MPGGVADHSTHDADGQVTWEIPEPPAGETPGTCTEPRSNNAPTRRRVCRSRAAEQEEAPAPTVGRARGEPERRSTGQGSRRAAYER